MSVASARASGKATGRDRAADIPQRLLLGSGPSPVPDRVLEALAAPTIGHLDPAFGQIMDETADMLRAVFMTANRATLPLSATGSGGMDALVANFVEPGDRVVCGVNGLFGERMADALERAGAEVARVEAQWGRALPLEALIEAARPGMRAMVVVHGETSTGVCQPLEGLAEVCRDREALLLIDCVTSLSGQRLEIDAWGVDAAFSGSQKCLNCPPGLAPFTVGPRGLARLRARATPVHSWYFDLSLIMGYWDPEDGSNPGASAAPRAAAPGAAAPPGGVARTYHHTAPINMIYGLREALRMVLEEDLPQRWERHRRAHEALHQALDVLGFERLAPEGEQLHPLLAVTVPDGVGEAGVRAALLRAHGIEVSGGLGPLAGRAWRIGVMGEGARPEPQQRLVTALASELRRDPHDALDALQAGWQAV